MLPSEREFLRTELERHSEEITLYGRTGRLINWTTLSVARLGSPKRYSFWCYYTDEAASKFFDELMDSGLVHYYARPKEDFSMIEALDHLNESYGDYLLVEDMS